MKKSLADLGRRPPAVVLVGHTDARMLRLLDSALNLDGHRVYAAADGSRLLDCLADRMLQGEHPDLIVADSRLPEWGGLDLLVGLRLACWPTPFILISENGGSAMARKVSRLGNAMIFKTPFDPDDLRTAVIFLLDRAAKDADWRIGQDAGSSEFSPAA